MSAPGTLAGERLSIDLIRRRLATQTVGHHLHLRDSVGSTNEVLRQLARNGAPDGTVVIAEAQTAGHGRLHKRWFSPWGVNLYASILFRRAIVAREVPVFSFVASLALTDAIRALGLEAAIKWPNDVLVDGKKVAGSLVECATHGEEVEYVILGVGVNLNVRRAALRAALGDAALAAGSLAEALGRAIDRNAFAAAFLEFVEKWAGTHAEAGAAPLLAAWRDRDILTGRRVEVRGEGAAYEGRVVGVDRQGYLGVRDSRGAQRWVLTGEVRLLD